jgi:hypothetical protein
MAISNENFASPTTVTTIKDAQRALKESGKDRGC